MDNRNILYIILFFLTASAFGQSKMQPLDITKKFMTNEPFNDLQNYICCELTQNFDTTGLNVKKEDYELIKSMYTDYTKQTLGEKIPAEVKRDYELMFQDNKNALVSIELTDKEYQADIYLNFVEQNGWKLSSIRKLALSHVMVSELAKKSDRQIIEYFIKNEEEFDHLLKEVLIDSNSEKVKGLQKQLQIVQIHSEKQISSDSYKFIIGGVTDNTVGFIYVKDCNKLPKVDGGSYIIIKKIKNGWYLFKTT